MGRRVSRKFNALLATVIVAVSLAGCKADTNPNNYQVISEESSKAPSEPAVEQTQESMVSEQENSSNIDQKEEKEIDTAWEEFKEDAYEAPVKYAKWVSENYDDLIKTYSPECCQRDFVFDQIKDYMTKRVAEEICKFVPDVFKTKVLYLDRVVSRFKNYFVKPKISSFWPLWREVLDSSKQSPDMYKNDVTKDLCKNAGFDYDDYTAVLLETYLLAVLGELDVVYPNGYRKHYEQHGVSGKAISLVRESVSDREASLLQEQEGDAVDGTDSEVKPIESSNTKILTEVFSAISKDMDNDDVLRLG